MDGVEEYFMSGRIDELNSLLNAFLSNKNITTKIDGSPAIVMWSDFPGLKGPGVSFKTIIQQTKKSTPKNVFTTVAQLKELAVQNQQSDEVVGKKTHIANRLKAFQYALQYIAPNIKPGYMLWGDVLFTETTKSVKNGNIVCTPNTLTYEFNDEHFPTAKNADFGICIHTAVNKSFQMTSISDVNKYLSSNIPSEVFVLSLDDIKPNMQNTSELKRQLVDVSKHAKDIKSIMSPEIGKSIKKAIKTNADMFEVIRSNTKCKQLSDDQIQTIVKVFSEYVDLKEKIVKNCNVDKIAVTYDGKKHAGEGYVVNDGKNTMKLVSTDDFTKHNIAHMRSLHENVEGDDLVIWTSSKDSNLFKYFIDKSLTFGNSGGSNYGFAIYGILEPRFSTDAKGYYKANTIKDIYGENIFQFKIPTDKVLFFQYDIYTKTKQGKNAKIETFVKDQLQRFGINFTDDEIKALTPKNANDNTSTEAMRFYKLCSRKYNLLKNGTIDSPIAGFVYQGKMDGLTYVGWKPYELEPVGYTNDNGKTWKYLKKSDSLYKAYVKGKSVASTEDPNVVYDGNKTPEKEQAYKLLRAFNANDYADDISISTYGMSEGIFYDIVIHDDKTIDASFKNNRPKSDGYVHYYRPRKNDILDKLYKLGFKFGKIRNAGIKFGSETDKDCWKFYDVPEQYMPKAVEKGIKLVGHVVDRPIEISCKHTNELYLTKCQIDEDVFKSYKVTLDDNEKKLNWTKDANLKSELARKYSWADSELLLSQMPVKKTKKTRKQDNESTIAVINKLLSILFD